MAQQSRLSRKMMMAAAGNAGEPLYVDDVFSTYVYPGNGSSQTITNGIDLSGEDGLVWIKSRTSATSNTLFTTELGNYLASDSTAAAISSAALFSTNTDGFDLLAGSSIINQSASDYVSWTFRKAPKFFDVVTYTGTGSATTVSHNLGSVPGCIIVKRTSTAGFNWRVYHRSLPTSDSLVLDTTQAAGTNVNMWNDTAATASVFSVGTDTGVNASGETYVAYLFAHNNSDGEFGTNGDEDIIKCGSYTGTGSAGNEVTLGFEPQWLLIKNADNTTSWFLFDNIRGMVVGGSDAYLAADLTQAEASITGVDLLANGFSITSTFSSLNQSGNDYIYIAIRRPHKPAESGTEVFTAYQNTGATTPDYDAGFPVDFAWYTVRNSAFDQYASARLIQGTNLRLNTTAAAAANADQSFDHMEGWNSASITNTNAFSWMFKRSPGFMDVVCYEGTGSATTVDHNLTVAPEMIIVKPRSSTGGWVVGHETTGWNSFMRLDTTAAEVPSQPTIWNNTSPTASVFSIGTAAGTNNSGVDYISILFATQDGISKVGSYTGNGTSQTIDCGFTSGARFVLIKRWDSTGDWFVWDSVRGIVAGNDPFIILNDTDAEDTLSSGTGAAGDHLDPDSSGFIVNETSGVAINTSSAEYIYLAIA